MYFELCCKIITITHVNVNIITLGEDLKKLLTHNKSLVVSIYELGSDENMSNKRFKMFNDAWT